jgi:hypothetical protein
LAITFGTAAKTHPNFDAKERVTMLADGLDRFRRDDEK